MRKLVTNTHTHTHTHTHRPTIITLLRVNYPTLKNRLMINNVFPFTATEQAQKEYSEENPNMESANTSVKRIGENVYNNYFTELAHPELGKRHVWEDTQFRKPQ